MPHFAYKGRRGGGELVQGVLEGASAGAVAEMLQGQGVARVGLLTRPRGG